MLSHQYMRPLNQQQLTTNNITMTLFLTLAVAAIVLCFGLFFHYIWAIPEYLEENKGKIASFDDYDSGVIQSFINARWGLQYQIREVKSAAELSELYWEIERLEMDYRDAIPDQVLIVHIDELFAYHDLRASYIKNFILSRTGS